MRLTIVLLLAAALSVGRCLSTAEAQSQITTDWTMFRHDIGRTGTQNNLAPIDIFADPQTVKILQEIWHWPKDPQTMDGVNGPYKGTPPIQGFVASPIVYNGIAYIGNTNGEMYAIDIQSGKLKWQFPNDPNNLVSDPPDAKNGLNGTCKYGQYGIQSSAVIATVDTATGPQTAVVFGAPDPNKNVDGGFGSARLWGLDPTSGKLIWQTKQVVAEVTKTNVSETCRINAYPPTMPPMDTSGFPPASPPYQTTPPERHEAIKWSSPLVLQNTPTGGTIAVGVAVDINHEIGSQEAPIQIGAVKLVDLSGNVYGTFYSESDSPLRPRIGGDVWNSPASDGSSIYFTTGNTRN
jgi:hypothetical protein